MCKVTYLISCSPTVPQPKRITIGLGHVQLRTLSIRATSCDGLDYPLVDKRSSASIKINWSTATMASVAVTCMRLTLVLPCPA